MQIDANQILDVYVGARLVAAEDGDFPVLKCMEGEHVDRHIEALARGNATHGRRAHAVDFHLAGIAKQHAFGDHLGFVVNRDGHEREFLGDTFGILYAIHATGAGIDKAPYPGAHGALGQLHGGQHVYFP